MSEQRRGPADGSESGAGWVPHDSGEGETGHHHQWGAPEQPDPRQQPPAPNGSQRPPEEPVHPWQQGRGGRGVPAHPGGHTPPSPQPPARPEQQATPPSDPRSNAGPPARPGPTSATAEPEASGAFGRPRGVEGSFDPKSRHEPPPVTGVQQSAPPPEALVQAFGRPPQQANALQRAPGESAPDPDRDAPGGQDFWTERGEHDPWRNPASGAVIGPPAVAEDSGDEKSEPGRGPLLSAREVLFGQRVRPRAFAALAAVALVLAMVGGFVGRITAEEGNPLTNPDVTLAEAEPGQDHPAGSIADVAQRVVPAVVSVEVRIGSQGGTGSGVVIDGNGYVVTNNHVVSMAADTPDAKVSTVFHDGTRAPARIVGRDTKTDLAVLKVEVANPTVADLGSSSDLAVGDDVIAIGSPLGLASTVTTGIVSSVNRPVRLAGEGTDTNAVIDAIQTDAAVNPGNSGGALVDGNGAVVGINSAIRTLGSGGEGGSIGLGFAIPIDDVRRIAEELIQTGRASHADLGVNAKSVSDGMADGAQVQNVRDGSPAQRAGLAEGDVIIRVGDRKVGSADELIVAVDSNPVGSRVPVTVVREGRELVLDAQL